MLGTFVGYAFIANLFSPVLFIAWAFITADRDIWSGALIYLGFGAIFAPIEGAIFGWLYRAWANPNLGALSDPEIFT